MCLLDVRTNLWPSFCEVVCHKATDTIPEVRRTTSFNYALPKNLNQPPRKIRKFRAIEVDHIFLNREFGYEACSCSQVA